MIPYEELYLPTLLTLYSHGNSPMILVTFLYYKTSDYNMYDINTNIMLKHPTIKCRITLHYITLQSSIALNLREPKSKARKS